MSGPEPTVTIVTSVGTEHQAVDIGERLVAEHLATCVNIVPCTRTLYRWHTGHICDDTEYLLIIKTTKAREAAVHDATVRLNSYELPEVMSTNNQDVEEVTGRWIADMVRDPDDPLDR
jgi:periplasmic divalent cation tolerance protein